MRRRAAIVLACVVAFGACGGSGTSDVSSLGSERRRLLAETDMFAIDHTSELYAHMNANYVRIGALPDFDNYGRMLEAVSRGDYFISMGEVLLPERQKE